MYLFFFPLFFKCYLFGNLLIIMDKKTLSDSQLLHKFFR